MAKTTKTASKNLIDTQIVNLGKRIKELRKKKGITNYEFFAYENGISRSQYGKYEQGSDMKFSTLLKLIEMHGLTVKEFFSQGFE